MLRFPAARSAIVSWNARAERGAIALSAEFADGERSSELRFASWAAGDRRSFSERDGDVRVAVETVLAERPVTAVHLRYDAPLERVFASTRAWDAEPALVDAPRGALGARAPELAVPALSQFVSVADAAPELRRKAPALCCPTALAMLLRYHGIDADVIETAGDVYDRGFEGTGNWAFNVAAAARRGLTACAVYLRDLDHVERLLAAGVPAALSIAWEPGMLPGAAIPRSAGHLVVVRGFTDVGDPLVNDPAQPELRIIYPRSAFARAWLGHGGAAFVVSREPGLPGLLQ